MMNLQYIYDASTSPPSQSALQYAVSPDTVFVSTPTQQMYADLTITVFNPHSQAVTCQAFRFGFLVGAQYGDLTTSAAGIKSVSDQTTLDISKQAAENPDNTNLYQFSSPSAGRANLQLAPQQSLVFHLNGVLINQAVGEGGAPIMIVEMTGSGSRPVVVQGKITISKQKPTLAIGQFTANPPTPINPGDPLTLKWQLTGSDHWQLYDYDADMLLYDSNTSTPKNANSYPPPPTKLQPQRNTSYELIVWAGQLFTKSYAEAMVMAAHFLGGPTATPPVIDPGQSSVLSWKTKYASQLTISAADFQSVVLNAPIGQYDVFPEAPNNQWTVSPTHTTDYNLVIKGPGGSSDQRYVPVSVNLPQPAIKSFTANPVVRSSGQGVTLAWKTDDAFSAKLSQKILATQETTPLGTVDLNRESYPITPPSGTIMYTLSLLGQGAVTGHVLVAETAGAFFFPANPSAMAFDGTNLWVWCDPFQLYKARPSDATVLGQYKLDARGADALSFIFDGANIWLTDIPNNSVTKVRASDGAVVGRYPTQLAPNGLAFDGQNIWVTNYVSNSVTKLRASDGTVLGNFPAGFAPVGIAFDGQNVWAANSGNNKVTKLRASDGAVLGTYAVGHYPCGVLFDGTNIWVSNARSNNVTKLRPSDGTVMGTFPTEREPIQLLFWAGYIWVVNTLARTLSILDAATGASQVTIPIGEIPSSLAFDGTYIWVGNPGAYTFNHRLMRLKP
jgi:hypothetical protein